MSEENIIAYKKEITDLQSKIDALKQAHINDEKDANLASQKTIDQIENTTGVEKKNAEQDLAKKTEIHEAAEESEKLAKEALQNSKQIFREITTTYNRAINAEQKNNKSAMKLLSSELKDTVKVPAKEIKTLEKQISKEEKLIEKMNAA
jgi:hypothetical protein